LYLEPQARYFDGAVVCLVNAGTASSAEGVAMAIQRLPRGHVMGFYATHGSFGLVGGESALPAGIGVQFTLGRSLDGGFGIQIDSDHNMTGGIAPDRRIPLTVETVQRKFRDVIHVELKQAEAFLVSLTPVHLSAFDVERRNKGAVLTWEISEPYEEASFHVWRQEIGTARIQLSSEPIAGTGGVPVRRSSATSRRGHVLVAGDRAERSHRLAWMGGFVHVQNVAPFAGTALKPSQPFQIGYPHPFSH
jgi:hypothetical protein